MLNIKKKDSYCYIIFNILYNDLIGKYQIAAGNRWNSSTNNIGSNANVWSASLNTDNENNAWNLNFNSDNINTNNNNRNNGMSVRSVSFLAFYGIN